MACGRWPGRVASSPSFSARSAERCGIDRARWVAGCGRSRAPSADGQGGQGRGARADRADRGAPGALGARDQAPLAYPTSFDQGSQFVSLSFGQECAKAGIARSMGSRGDCWDNAVAESFFATLKKELVHRRSWSTREQLRREIFDYVEIFYNAPRRHSTLGIDLSDRLAIAAWVKARPAAATEHLLLSLPRTASRQGC